MKSFTEMTDGEFMTDYYDRMRKFVDSTTPMNFSMTEYMVEFKRRNLLEEMTIMNRKLREQVV